MIHSREIVVQTQTLPVGLNCDVCGSEIWNREFGDTTVNPVLPAYYVLWRDDQGGSYKDDRCRLDVCCKCADSLVEAAREGRLDRVLTGAER